MKRSILLFISIVIAGHVFSQARNATVEYQKAPQSAVEMEVPYPEKTVSKAIEDKLEKLGYKGKESKGFVVYRSVRMPELGPDAYDLYFKTDRKSRKEKDVTILTMLVSSGMDKFLDNSSTVMSNAKTFLDSQVVVVEAYDLEVQVGDQESQVKKADKKMVNLTEEAEDLQKKKKKLEKDIEENLKAQEDQKKETEKQNLILSTLRGKRKQ